jgi:hypothetical protein
MTESKAAGGERKIRRASFDTDLALWLREVFAGAKISGVAGGVWRV